MSLLSMKYSASNYFPIQKVRKNKLFSRKISNRFHCWYKPRKNLILFVKTFSYLQKPYANLSKTNVVSPKTGLMCVLIAGLRQFSFLSDFLVIRMDLNFRAGD